MNAISKAKNAAVLVLVAAAAVGTMAPAFAHRFSFGDGMYCATPAGVFGLRWRMPLGSACVVDTFDGTEWGYVRATPYAAL